MEPFRRDDLSEAAVWPPAQPPVAYVQVGDLVEMWVRRERADFATCEACQTVNHQSDARCRTCGCALPARDEADAAPEAPAAPEAAPPPMALNSLTNVMRLAVLPPLLLFAGFAGWYQWQAPGSAPPVAIAASMPATSPARAEPRHRVWAAAELGQSAGEVALVARRESATAAADRATITEPVTPADIAAPARPRKATVAQSPVRREQNPLAACSGGNFFARAICVNSRCAEPKAAQLGQCREAIRQRRIDEARRNPTLMG